MEGVRAHSEEGEHVVGRVDGARHAGGEAGRVAREQLQRAAHVRRPAPALRLHVHLPSDTLALSVSSPPPGAGAPGCR